MSVLPSLYQIACLETVHQTLDFYQTLGSPWDALPLCTSHWNLYTTPGDFCSKYPWAWFLNHSTTDTWSQIILLWGAVYCRIFYNILGLEVPLFIPICDDQNVSKDCQMSPGRQNHPSWEILIPFVHLTSYSHWRKIWGWNSCLILFHLVAFFDDSRKLIYNLSVV